MQSWLKTMVIGAVIVVGAFMANPAWAKEPIQVTRGQFARYADGLDKDYDIAGMATMVRSAGGYTSVVVRVYGLAPNTDYAVHVHNQACRIEAGGAHYQHEVGGAVDATNEIWPIVTTNSGGNGYSKSVNDFVAGLEARSVVIHDTDNTRLACADLRNIAVTPYTFSTKRIQELAQLTAYVDNPELMAADRFQPAASLNIATSLADNPELMVAQRYEFIGQDGVTLGSTHYANNPELMVAERFQAEIPLELGFIDTFQGMETRY
ncbi:MAG: hypothetical protein KDJ52_13940 [Anaerolineae bacterium]|nr:hypothetical protein [Anaerolineae bacterium]